MDVYAAGEAPIDGVDGSLVCDAVRAHAGVDKAFFVPEKERTVASVVERLQPGDLLITMGAGDVTGFGPRIVEALSAR